MYSFRWNKRTGGYTLVPQAGQFIASEIRPVFAPELKLVGFDTHFSFDGNETRPICWAKQNVYIYRGEEIAKLEKTQFGRPLTPKFLVKPQKLHPVDIEAMLRSVENQNLMAALVADTQKRIKELYDQFSKSCEVAYIAFSGGKDSVLLLDLCHRTLPLSVPVVFSDTDMELPDTYAMWEEVQKRYPDRIFLKAKANVSALENWNRFGPPSRTVRWCCSVHKSTPAILLLRQLHSTHLKRVQSFIGVRNDESLARSEYEDVGIGVKNASQVNAYPIISWGAHELWFYTFAEHLPINMAYQKGLPRVGCVLCPEASEKYAWFVNAIYPNVMKKYNDTILRAVDKEFETEEDRTAYLSSAGWQARKSGETLKSRIYRPEERIENNALLITVSASTWEKAFEWLKTIGTIQNDTTSRWCISCRKGKEILQFLVTLESFPEEMVCVRCSFSDTSELKLISKLVRNCFYKAIACVGCKSCEAECQNEAISFIDSQVRIDENKCIHCYNCHNVDYGCWRFKSMYVSEGSSKQLAGINKYTNFGLREDWITVFVTEKENFSQTTALGKKMIPAARAWFRQARLMQDKNCEPCKLLDLAEKYGSGRKLLWDSIWIALANHAPLIKWYVTATDVNHAYSTDDFFALMGADIKDATKRGGISAFRDMLTKSPFGVSEYPIVQLTMKGRVVETMTRIPHAVDDLALLYGLYLMAEVAEQSSFSISQLMTADFTAKYISPIVAFAMPVMTFQQQCQGLADRYSDFIQCNFTLGLDEITLKTDSKKLDDVVELMLQV